VERWLLPGACLLCHRPVEPGEADPLICAPCRNRWTPLPHPQCSRCGQPVVAELACRLCAAWPEGLEGVRSACWLDTSARDAVHALKYSGWWRVAESMADAIRTRIRFPPGAMLVPVPLSTARERTRGYNQSAVLAEFLARTLRMPLARGLLHRRRDTKTQTALTPEERQANLRGAFAAAGVGRGVPVLVDDVFTTGATLAEAGRALLDAGAGRVSGVTFARALRPLADAAAGA
jgi:ComF family protein